MLCISGDMFVKWIVTVPALAVSELLVNFSAPLGSADSDSVPVRTDDAADDADAAADVAAVDALDAIDEAAELTLLLALLPQPAAPTVSATATRVATEYLDKEHLLSLNSRKRSGRARSHHSRLEQPQV